MAPREAYYVEPEEPSDDGKPPVHLGVEIVMRIEVEMQENARLRISRQLLIDWFQVIAPNLSSNLAAYGWRVLNHGLDSSMLIMICEELGYAPPANAR